MADHAPRYPSYNSDIEPYEEKLTGHAVTPYSFGQSGRPNYPEESAPLFLSDYDDEPDPSEYMPPVRRKRGSYFSSRILAAVLASTAIAFLVAMYNSDAARDVIASAKASTTAVLSAASAAVQPNSQPTPPKARDVQLKDTTRLSAPGLSAPESQPPGPRNITTAAVTPSRDDIKSAYQSALQGGAPQSAAVPEPTTPADTIHHLDPNEIASLLKRADALVVSGDLAAARLVLRRAAEAGDAHAAMMLAGTYNPSVLEKLGVHGVVPDLAMARSWYEKARQFGAPEAASQLDLLASKQH